MPRAILYFFTCIYFHQCLLWDSKCRQIVGPISMDRSVLCTKFALTRGFKNELFDLDQITAPCSTSNFLLQTRGTEDLNYNPDPHETR